MKQCNKCGEVKELDDFAFRNKAKGTKSPTCKQSQKDYAKANYQEKTQYYIDKARQSNKTASDRNKQYVIDYLKSHPCVDCGESDIEVLQFDHVEMVRGRGNRIANFRTHSLDTLKKELAKCEVRCGNCHIRTTRKQMGWLR